MEHYRSTLPKFQNLVLATPSDLTDLVILVDVIRYNQGLFLLFHVIYEVFCPIASQIVGQPEKTLDQVF